MSFMSILSVWLLMSLCLCWFVLVVKANDVTYKAQSRLLDHLLPDYDKTAHPSPAPGIPVNVTLGLAIAQIVSVDEKTEGINLNVWHRMGWKDYRLSWDPLQFNGVTGVLLNSEYLWIPDITLYKPLSVEGTRALGEKQNDEDLSWKASVRHDGSVSYNFPGMIYAQCPLNIADYPFDQHNCTFLFSSWVHNEREINLDLRPSLPMDLSHYIENNEWEVISHGSHSYTLKYNCCPHGYKMLSFYISIKRGASSYISNYIIPSILIIVLSLMMFTLPPEVGKRMEIGINLLLCLSVYLTILNTKMPARSDVFPLLSKFYGCCIFILTLALLCTCWVVTYYFHDMSGWKIYPMSKFVQIGLLHYLKRLLRFPSKNNKVQPLKIGSKEPKTIVVKPNVVNVADPKPVSKTSKQQSEGKPVKNDKKDKKDAINEVEKRQEKRERKERREPDVDKRREKKVRPEGIENERKERSRRKESVAMEELGKTKEKAAVKDEAPSKKGQKRPSVVSTNSDKRSKPSKGNVVKTERNPRRDQEKIAKGRTNKGFDKKEQSVREEPSLKNKGRDESTDKTEKNSFDRKVTEEKRIQEKNEKTTKESVDLLVHLASYFTENSQRKNNRNQWRQAAIVLNRLFTIMLATSIVIITIAIFLAR